MSGVSGPPRWVLASDPRWGRPGRAGSAIVRGMSPPDLTSPSVRRDRAGAAGGAPLPAPWRGWVAAGIGACAGHFLLLQLLSGAAHVDRGAASPPTRSVTRIELVTVRSAAASPGPGPTAAAVAPASERRPSRAASAAQTRVARPAPSPAAAAVTADAAAASSGSPDAGGLDDGPVTTQRERRPALPSYPAQLPGPFVIRLAVLRGEQLGDGEMRFERDAGGTYRLRLALQTPQQVLMEMTSTGPSGVTGLAPERFTDRRRGRSTGAVNFDRVAGEARFSARAAAAPIGPAAQDRLSWMIQLGGVVQSDPALRRPGAQVLLQVVGARGGTVVWRFEAAGPDLADDPRPAMPGAVRYVREPEGPYDQRVEVWLDPSRDFLPARVRLTLVPLGQRLEFWATGGDVRS